jgi:hypothetical protein
MIKTLVLAMIGLLPEMACAADTPIAMRFAAVIQNPGHRQMVLDAARQSPAWTHISCAAASFAPAPEIGVYVPVQFGKDGEPIAGAWREGVVASGCGAPITLNVLTRITAPATLATGFLLPGATIADPVLQNVAQSFALRALGGLPAGCEDGYVANTVFTGYDSPNGNSGPWKEIWTLDLCGPQLRVLMHFIPDATGTTINAQPD